MKKQKTVRKPSKLEALTQGVWQECSHQSSARIISRRNVLNYEIAELEQEIAGLQHAIANARERKARDEAVVVGLGLVLERR